MSRKRSAAGSATLSSSELTGSSEPISKTMRSGWEQQRPSDLTLLKDALRALKHGDVSVRLPKHVEADGPVVEVFEAFNDTAEQLDRWIHELVRVNDIIVNDGDISLRVDLANVGGAWAKKQRSLNNLLDRVAYLSTEATRVLSAVASGDLHQKMRLQTDGVELRGEFARMGTSVNAVAATLRTVSSEVTRVAREVGTEGKLGAQAQIPDASGAFRDLTDSVNVMANNLTSQVRSIAGVTTAIANGDLSQKITVEARGELLELKTTINAMVDRLNSFSAEVTRVAREVGTEGTLGVQAEVKDVAGTWKELTDNVNGMAGNLTNQVRNIAVVATAVANGDLSRKITVEAKGEILELKNTLNAMVDQLNAFSAEVTRVAREVGTEGKLGAQADVKDVTGTWRDLTDTVNQLAGNLTNQVRNIALVATAVANGDLSRKITVEAKGEILELKNTLNAMVDQLNAFSAEVTRVAREVGTEGKLGAQAAVPGVSGTWKDLTDSVNWLAGNLTNQVRNIAVVATAVANGDLSRKITVEAKGEILELKNTLNAMVDQLNAFSAEVTRIARDVGIEGKLGAQAEVLGVSGTWKDLTDNVNQLAGNLTNQVRNIALVATAVANGDLSQKITVEARGEILELKNTLNAMVDRLRSFASEVTRVARDVGTEGKLGAQAEVLGVSGTWKDLTESVNGMAKNLTSQVRNIALVATAIANGDLSQKITVDVRGEISELKNTINAMVDRLNAFSAEVTRVAREVGTEGKLGVQAEVKGVSGTWKELTDNVNLLAGNLTNQVRNIAIVVTAIANGDLSQKITVDVRGEILELKDTINATVDRLNSFSAEVTRVAREVGTEGKLGAQAEVKGAAGTWKELTDNVNLLAGNLTNQVRNIALVATAIASGDLSQKITVEAKGEILELKNALNATVDRLNAFSAEVTRVAREVGTEGKLGAQAQVPGVAGTWKELTDNVNLLAGNLTNQVRNIALVATAIANGDLSQKITVEAKGEILELKNTLNATVDRLRSFAAEVTRVAREVGTEGKLGAQAQVPGVGGTWKELTDNVNVMASNLTSQVRGISKVVTAVANGDLSQRLFVEARGEIAALSDTINNMTDTLRTFADQVTTVAREVGLEGKLGGQARVPGAAGTWKELTDNVNLLAGNLTSQVRNIALVTTAVASGDLSKKITVEAQGEILELKDTINAMVERLRIFSAEVTRVAREVGTDGKLGGQAQVPGVGGTWKELTDNVNVMASNLTDQVRGIGRVVTAVANGDLSKKLLLVARGEIATLADTINNMTDTLRTFAEQVTTVAREVGIEGRLGGQAKVPGAAGTWRDLTDNVNQLAGNLTAQVRAIAEVASAVIKGDLSREITVEALGEVLALKDTINQMIKNLRDTTRTNQEQDWLKSNLARFFGMMQGQRNIEALAQLIMSEVTPLVSGQRGAFYVMETTNADKEPVLKLISSYAHTRRKQLGHRFSLGDGLVGQCALERKPIVVSDVPEDYSPIGSGTGEAAPRNVAVLPVLFEGQTRGVVEVASFSQFTAIHLSFLEQLMLNLGVVINLIGASSRTEELLKELQRSNMELETRRHDLEEKAQQLEAKNREIARASSSLEDKAKELAQVSQYKSQFLANMSHEIRTPLNSMMILAQMLAANENANLTPKEREYAEVIYSSGRDLLALINQLLDLSKVEAGRIEAHPERVQLSTVAAFVQRSFKPVADQRKLSLSIEIAPGTPPTVTTDQQLLQQILKNLVSNALKFTERGSVRVGFGLAPTGRTYRRSALTAAPAVLKVDVVDTGIGIPKEKHEMIFEAFQQADATSARKYGGTGLGLTISREYARVLEGEVSLESTEGVGSTFTLWLPLTMEDLRALPMGEALSTDDQPANRTPVDGLRSEGSAETTAMTPQLEMPVQASTGTENPEMEILAGKVVLVVDDDARNLYTMATVLERYHMRVLPSSSALEAYAELRSHPEIDLVLMDLMMPEIDGLAATRSILRERPTMPIIALTAKASESDRASALSAGMCDYLAKPVDVRHLVSTMRRYFVDKGRAIATS